MYSLFGDSENRENNYLKIRDLLSIALFNILGSFDQQLLIVYKQISYDQIVYQLFKTS
jgi:hypothetical protein